MHVAFYLSHSLILRQYDVVSIIKMLNVQNKILMLPKKKKKMQKVSTNIRQLGCHVLKLHAWSFFCVLMDVLPNDSVFY